MPMWRPPYCAKCCRQGLQSILRVTENISSGLLILNEGFCLLNCLLKVMKSDFFVLIHLYLFICFYYLCKL